MPSRMRRSRILCTWERGSGKGHLHNLVALTDALRQNGCDVVASVKDVDSTRQMLAGQQATVFGLPAKLQRVFGRLAHSHAELLFNLGFANPARLRVYLHQWRELLREVAPSAVVCEHADGALLAAYSMGIPAAVMGHGFFHPPQAATQPAYALGLEVDSATIVDREQRVVAAINSALRVFYSRGIDRLADLYAFAERIVVGFPELDCYGMRAEFDYLGMPGPRLRQASPVWKRPGDKAFCYFTQGHLPRPAFVEQLSGAGISLLICAPGIDDGHRRALERQGVSVSGELVDIEQVCAQCRYVYSEGNQGTTSAILRHGRVPLLLPNQVEQLATAVRLAVEGLAILPDVSGGKPMYLGMIERLNAMPDYEPNAQVFSEYYKAWDARACVAKMRESQALQSLGT